jgi:hypothetical protein
VINEAAASWCSRPQITWFGATPCGHPNNQVNEQIGG